MDSKQLKQPKLSKTALHGIDDRQEKHDLTKHNWIQKSKWLKSTQYKLIKIAIKTQINQKQNNNTKLYGILHKIAQGLLKNNWTRCTIGISKQHTNSKQKLKPARQYGSDEQEGIMKNTKLKSR